MMVLDSHIRQLGKSSKKFDVILNQIFSVLRCDELIFEVDRNPWIVVAPALLCTIPLASGTVIRLSIEVCTPNDLSTCEEKVSCIAVKCSWHFVSNERIIPFLIFRLSRVYGPCSIFCQSLELVSIDLVNPHPMFARVKPKLLDLASKEGYKARGFS